MYHKAPQISFHKRDGTSWIQITMMSDEGDNYYDDDDPTILRHYFVTQHNLFPTLQ